MKSNPNQDAPWLRTLWRYIVFVAVANLIWEFAHLPLYTIWETGTAGELAFAAVHCAGGDILIALSSVMLALFFIGEGAWPVSSYVRIAILTLLLGLSYTIFSEWLNIEIRKAWAYRGIMPILPILGVGLSPILQWIIIPIAAFLWVGRQASEKSTTG